MTVYRSTVAATAAQDAITAHSTGTPAGLCTGCGEREPCRTREAAHATLARLGILARRTPGASGPHWQQGRAHHETP